MFSLNLFLRDFKVLSYAGWSCFEQTYKSGGTVRLTCVDQTVRGLEWNPCRCAEGQKVLPLCKSLGCKGLHASQLRNWSRRRNWVKTYRVHYGSFRLGQNPQSPWQKMGRDSIHPWNFFVRTWRRPGVQNWHCLLEDRSAWTFTMTVWIDVTFPIKRIGVQCIKQDSNKLFSMERYLQISTNHDKQQTTVNILPELIFSVSEEVCLSDPLRSVKAALRADAEHHGRDGAEAARLWEASKKPKATARRGETCRTEQQSNLDTPKNRGANMQIGRLWTNRRKCEKRWKGWKGSRRWDLKAGDVIFVSFSSMRQCNSENLRSLFSSSQQRSCEASGKCHFNIFQLEAKPCSPAEAPQSVS